MRPDARHATPRHARHLGRLLQTMYVHQPPVRAGCSCVARYGLKQSTPARVHCSNCIMKSTHCQEVETLAIPSASCMGFLTWSSSGLKTVEADFCSATDRRAPSDKRCVWQSQVRLGLQGRSKQSARRSGSCLGEKRRDAVVLCSLTLACCLVAGRWRRGGSKLHLLCVVRQRTVLLRLGSFSRQQASGL